MTVIIIEDEMFALMHLKKIISSLGYTVVETYYNAEDFLNEPNWNFDGALVANSLQDALDKALVTNCNEAFIIGGGEIYKQSMHYLDKVYLTRVMAEPEGEVVFPDLPTEDWELISSEAHQANERDEHDFVFEVYIRNVD